METFVLSIFDLNIQYILAIFIFVPLTYFIWKVKQPLEIIKETPSLLKSSHRIASDLPPINPNGWNAVLESSDLSKNEIKTFSMFGKDLIVFRGSSGKCYVFDAYCPHLGANLGVGGTIVGDSVRCPFHGWVFDQDGKCTHIPGIDCLKSMNAEIKNYDTIEINDFICVWHHSRGEKPNSFLENSEHFKQKGIIYRGKATNIAYCHIQEIYENGLDSQHFFILHPAPDYLGNLMKKPRFYDTILKFFYLDYNFDDWNSESKCNGNTLYFTLDSNVWVLGLLVMSAKIRFQCIGLTISDSTIEMNFFFGKRIFYMTNAIIQTSEMKHAIISRVYSKSGPINWFLSRFVINNMCAMIERDAIMWSNKKLLTKPNLTKKEQKIAEYRRWCKQFY